MGRASAKSGRQGYACICATAGRPGIAVVACVKVRMVGGENVWSMLAMVMPLDFTLGSLGAY